MATTPEAPEADAPGAGGAVEAALARIARACEEHDAVAAALLDAERDAAQLREQLRALDGRGETLASRLRALRVRQERTAHALRAAARGARDSAAASGAPAGGAAPAGDGARLDDGATGQADGGSRILLVDDEPHFTDLIAEYLGGRGFDVRVAPTGERALDTLEPFHPRIVLLDLMMPGIGGMETLRRIKARRPETSVIMVTAIDDRDTARQALALGASDYITKPLTLDYLEQVLAVHVPGLLPTAPVPARPAVPPEAPEAPEAPPAPARSFFARR